MLETFLQISKQNDALNIYKILICKLFVEIQKGDSESKDYT